MDARKPASPLIEEIAENVENARARGPAPAKYVSYRALLMRDAAVWKKANRVWFSTAGANPQVHRLTCVSGSEARRLAMEFVTELRKARSDDEYNAIVMRVLQEIRGAWADNVKVRHVHTCDARVVGVMTSDGKCPCGFDWSIHQLTRECPCVVEIDSSDQSGEWQFVVHRRGYAKREMVSV